jgi:hypothetical protein
MSEEVCTPLLEPEFAAFVALDWADEKHCCVLREAGSDRSESRVLAHTPEAFAEWAGGLYERFSGRPIAICLEQSRGAVVYALT